MRNEFHIVKKQNNPTDLKSLKVDFPIFKQNNRGKPLVYLDSAASAQKPWQVINAIMQFYSQDYANIHRGIYELSERASAQYEDTRKDVQKFIHACDSAEIVFVRSTTEGINLVAQSYGRTFLKPGDEIILTTMEHHSNIVPWYLLKQQIGIVIKEIQVLDDGSLDIESYKQLLSPRTRFIALTHVSNALGTINPIKEIIAMAKSYAKANGEEAIPVLVDGAQAAPHLPVDVQDLDCDFYVFSGHKCYGPTGIGVLYGKKHYLDRIPPYQGGGDMIATVAFDQVTFAQTPQKFEAGTPHIAGVIGLSSAIQYLTHMGMEKIFAHEQQLLKYAEEKLQTISGLKMIGTVHPKVGVISFVLAGIHPHDIGTVLDHHGIAVRASHHCAMPLMQRFNVPATVRVSFGMYTDESDIEALIAGIQLAKRLFS